MDWALGCLWIVDRGAAAWAAWPSETLLPKETVGFLAISNVDTLDAQWKKTQIGQLDREPRMRPFRKDLRRQMQEHWSSLRERFGIALDDLQGVPGGELGAAMIEPKPGQAATALVIDVTGHVVQAHALVAKATGNLLKGGAKQSALKIGGVVVDVFELPLPARSSFRRGPPRRHDTRRRRRTRRRAGAGRLRPGGRNLLIITDNLDVTRGILGRVADGRRAASPGSAASSRS